MEFWLHTVLVLAVSAVTVLGLPDGAPMAACDNGLIPAHTNSTNTANGSVPFYVNTSYIGGYYTPGRTYTIVLSGNATANNTDFRGFIIQARTMADGSPVGQFMTGNSTDQQVQCTNNTAVTHTNREEKTRVELTWAAPMGGYGAIVFRYAFVDRYSVVYTLNVFWAQQNTFVIGEVHIVRFTQSTYRVNEDDRSAQIVLVLSHPASTNTTVTLSSIDKSAKGGGDDYVSGPYNVTIPAGQTNASVDVPITDDNIYEQNEKFKLFIDRTSTLNGVFIGSPRKATVIIADDSDCIPCNVTRNVTVSEGSAITTFFSSNPRTTFTCKLDRSKSESCTSPMAYTNLSKGKHRIIVVAKCPCKAGRDIKRFRFRIR